MCVVYLGRRKGKDEFGEEAEVPRRARRQRFQLFAIWRGFWPSPNSRDSSSFFSLAPSFLTRLSTAARFFVVVILERARAALALFRFVLARNDSSGP